MCLLCHCTVRHRRQKQQQQCTGKAGKEEENRGRKITVLITIHNLNGTIKTKKVTESLLRKRFVRTRLALYPWEDEDEQDGNTKHDNDRSNTTAELILETHTDKNIIPERKEIRG